MCVTSIGNGAEHVIDNIIAEITQNLFHNTVSVFILQFERYAK